jgi:hypothetical protein
VVPDSRLPGDSRGRRDGGCRTMSIVICSKAMKNRDSRESK